MADNTLAELFHQRFGEPPHVPRTVAENPALAGIAGRASCRSFTDQPVPSDLLGTLCAAALCAPSKSDLQQRDILIIEDPAIHAALTGLLDRQTWITGAPQIVVFLANNRRQRQVQDWQGHRFANDHLDAFFNASVDGAIALAFFVIAAEAAGLGCCPVSTIRDHLPAVRDLLGLPDHVFPVAAMAVGHPAQRGAISARLPLRKTVHRDRFADITPDEVQDYDTRRGPPQWSRAKARMYAAPQRTDFGAFMRAIGFRLE